MPITARRCAGCTCAARARTPAAAARERRVNPRRTVEIDAMLDPAEIVVDNDQRPAQRWQVAGIARLDTFKPPALAGIAHRAQLATHRISVAVWHGGNLARSVYITLASRLKMGILAKGDRCEKNRIVDHFRGYLRLRKQDAEANVRACSIGATYQHIEAGDNYREAWSSRNQSGVATSSRRL